MSWYPSAQYAREFPESPLTALRKFDPRQPRDQQGRWTDVPGADFLGGAQKVEPDQVAPGDQIETPEGEVGEVWRREPIATRFDPLAINLLGPKAEDGVQIRWRTGGETTPTIEQLRLRVEKQGWKIRRPSLVAA